MNVQLLYFENLLYAGMRFGGKKVSVVGSKFMVYIILERRLIRWRDGRVGELFEYHTVLAKQLAGKILRVHFLGQSAKGRSQPTL